jgi:hypothetical protein
MDGFKGWDGAVATLLPDKGDRISVPYLSYHEATLPGRWKAGKLEPEESLASHLTWSARSRVRAPLEEKFLAFISNRDNLCLFRAQWIVKMHFE